MTDAARSPRDLLPDADRALVRTVDALPDTAYAEPSLLPGWTRGHVIAHLTLNAEGLAGVLHGAHLGEPAPMYASQEARDGDIEELAGADPTELRERLLAAIGRFAETVDAMAPDDWEGRFERTPGAPSTIGLVNIPLMRLREVEIHHADLGAGYTADDWSPAFREVLLESARKLRSDRLTVRATDLDRTWHYGGTDADDPGPVVTGTASALGWWLTGRGSGEGLTCDTGELPRMEAW